MSNEMVLVIKEGIRVETDNVFSFGDFTAATKLKINSFEIGGDLYNLRSHAESTRIEKNGALLFEAIPGATCFYFRQNENQTAFSAAGLGATQITLELEPNTEYTLTVGTAKPTAVKTSSTGKISFNANLNKMVAEDIKLDRI